MILKSLLFLLSLGLTHTNDDLISTCVIQSYTNNTFFNDCNDATSTDFLTTSPILTTTPIPSTPDLTTTTYSTPLTSEPATSSTTVSTPEPTSVDGMTSSTVPSVAPSSSVTSTSTTNKSTPKSSPAESSSTLSSSTSSSLRPTSPVASSLGTQSTVIANTEETITSSFGSSSSSGEKTTTIVPESSTVGSSSSSTSSTLTSPASSASTGAETTSTTTGKVTSPSTASTSKLPTTSLPSSTTVPLVPSSSFSLPASSAPQSSPSSSSSTVVSPSTPLVSSSTSQRATSVTSTSAGILSTLLSGGITTPGGTTMTTEKDFRTIQDDSTTVTPSTLPSTLSTTEAFEGSSPVQTTTLPESTTFASSASSETSSTPQGESTTTVPSPGTEPTVTLSTDNLPPSSSTLTSFTSTGTTLETDTTEGGTTVGGTEKIAATETTEALFSSTDSISTTTSESPSSSTTTPAVPAEPTSSTNGPTTRPPVIQMRRTAPGQQQGHPETSSELPKTTLQGTTETIQETMVTAPVTTATTLKEILSGRRYATPVRPAIPMIPIPTSTEFPETSPSPVPSSSETTTGISSKKPSTPWEMPMTAVQSTKKEILSGRRYVTPEKIVPGKATTTTGSGNAETTVLSTVDTTVFAPGSTEKRGETTASDPASTGVSTTLGISSSVSSSTLSATSTPGQTSVETSPPLTTRTEFDSSTKVTSSSVSSSAATTLTLKSTTEPETVLDLTSKAMVETTVQPPTTTPSPSSTGTRTPEKKTSTESKTTSGSPSTSQKYDATTLSFTSTVSSTAEESLPTTVSPTSSSFTTGNERSGTSTATGTTSGSTTLSPKKYGEGCEDRCPEGSLVGSGRCYQLAPAKYQPSFHLSFSWCGRDRVGHLIEKDELMEDVLLIRDWMTSMDYAMNTSIYVGPFKTVGSQVRGEYTNMSRVSGGLVPTEVIRMQEIKNFIGICAIPEFCGTFNCSFVPLYKSLQGLLAEPMPAPVSPGTDVFVQCLSPSDTLLNLKCDSYGKFNPRPDTPSVTCRVSREFFSTFPCQFRVGHLIEKEELMEDVLLIRDWMTSMDYAMNTSIYVGPFKTVGSQIRGEYTNLSRVSGGLVPTEVIRMQEIKNFVGICAVPEFCGTFNCSFLPLYKSLQGLLTEPMPAPVSPGTAVAVQCLSPSDTLLNLKCDSYGKFNPRPDTPSVTCRVSRQFSREKEVPDNKPIRKSCDCYEDGTESCQAVEGGFRCQCKKGWLKNRCWKSDDACWVPAGNVNKCNGHGKCHSYPDLFVCECDPGFGGATCNLNVTNVTWFGSDDSVPFWTAGKAVTVVVTGIEWAEMFLKAALKSSGLISSDGPSDPLSYTSSMRKFTVAAAGVGMILYGHPHFYFDLWGFGCRLVFLFVNIAMLFAFWLLIMESFTTFTVYYGLGRNRWILGVEKAKDGSWSEVDEPEDKWFLAKPFTIYLGVAYAFLMEFYLFTWFFDYLPSPYTCLGEIYSLRNPATLVNLEIMAVMAYMATGFAILAQVSKRLWPEVIAEQYSFYEFHKGRTAIEVLNKVERCQHLQLVQAPVIFLNYGFAVWSQDQVASGLPQTFEFYFSIPLMCFSVLVSAIGVLTYSPFIYGHVMKAFLPRLSWLRIWTQFTPAEHGYLSHSEVINRKQDKDVVLPENKDWPKHPSEKAYIAIERRHQCLRRLTRQYLEMRLMGTVKNDALELIAGRFLLAIPEGDPESTQWQHLLKKWTRDVRRMDGTNFEIPRNRAETRERYWNRVMDASLFTRADVLRENADWMRFLYLFQLLGHIPLEKANGPRSCQQIRHHSQCPEYRAAWEMKKDTENWPEIAMIISPELFPNLEKIQKVRGGARQKHTILVDLPAVKRYLWVDFLNRAFFGWEQVQIRNSAMKNQHVEEPIEHRLEQIRLHVLERRLVPRTITHLGRAEWLAGHDLITIYQPSAPILIGANDQPREAINIPPLIVEREGIPTSLYRW